VSRGAPFEARHERYEAWFQKHQPAYISELLALRPGRGQCAFVVVSANNNK
jgi:hypothetical protein